MMQDPGAGEGGYFLVRLMEMYRYGGLGSHFHDWIDYNGIAFSIDLLEAGRTFSDFGEQNSAALHIYG